MTRLGLLPSPTNTFYLVIKVHVSHLTALVANGVPSRKRGLRFDSFCRDLTMNGAFKAYRGVLVIKNTNHVLEIPPTT